MLLGLLLANSDLAFDLAKQSPAEFQFSLTGEEGRIGVNRRGRLEDEEKMFS